MKSACVHPVTTSDNWVSEIVKTAIQLGFTVRTTETFQPDRPLSIFEMYAVAGQIQSYAANGKGCQKT